MRKHKPGQSHTNSGAAVNTVGPDFDEAIILDILSWLPAKSLVRFRSVCKSWLTLISDPYFVKKHHSRIRANCLQLLVRREGDATILTKDDAANIAITELDFPAKFFCVTIYGSCNGLICAEFECGNIIIWNPSTRESKRLPEAPTVDVDLIERHLRPRIRCPNELYWFGFGYDSTIEDYKVIRATQTTMHVFTLKTGSWRKIKNIRVSLMPKESRGCLLNETLHWVATDDRNMTKIVAFDLVEEIVSKIISAPANIGYYSRFHSSIGSFGNSLFVCNDLKIWVMKQYGVEESWTEVINIIPEVIPFGFAKVLCILENGEVFLYHSTRGLGLYNPVKKTFRNVMDKCDPVFLPLYASYEETLVSPLTSKN